MIAVSGRTSVVRRLTDPSGPWHRRNERLSSVVGCWWDADMTTFTTLAELPDDAPLCPHPSCFGPTPAPADQPHGRDGGAG